VDPSREHAPLDRATLEKLYVKLEKPMFNVVYRWTWNASDAQEIVQDAFLRVWRARENVDAATVQPLLYRRAARIRRWIGLDDAGDPPSPQKTSEQSLANEQARARVRAAIDALPEGLRRVVTLTEFSELSHAEVGALLGIPAGTVGSRRNTALARLAAALGDLEGAW
jgi:RNA polymerase sigma-70 factor (ECF subfamily)